MRSHINLMARYRALLRRFGPQGWWPIYEFQISDFKFRMIRRPCPKRLTESDRFQICVGAILTQNTAWRNVEQALTNIFSPPPQKKNISLSSEISNLKSMVRGRDRAPWSPAWIAPLRHDRLAHLIRPAGYFNQKAKKLQIFSRWLLEQYDGSLARFFRQPTEQCRTELLSLWGIGPETADSMLLYAGRHPVFVIDAYTKRWLTHTLSNTQCLTLQAYDGCQRFFMDHLPRDARLFNEFHALIVAWGKAKRG